jgi:hypothetical protein
MVSKRYFLHASGFDPYGAPAQHRRYVREAARFAATWNVSARVSELQQNGTQKGAAASGWTVITEAPGWQVVTEYGLLDWSDIVRGELARPAGVKLWGGLVAFADLVLSGTARRYFSANWRYGMFFLVPFLNVFLFAAVAGLAGWYAAAAIAAAVSFAVAGGAAAVVVPAAVFAMLMRWPGERWRVGQAMADWIFARGYLRGWRPDMDARLDAFAARIIACARASDADEVVVCGHSLGAAVAVDALARAFERDPMLGRHGPALALLTVGAVIPKITLHPRGARLREQVHRLAAEPSLTWAEYQARDDFISFYKFDPVKLVPIGDDHVLEGLIIGRVQIFRMVSEATWRRVRANYMRLHYQFVMANEKRTAYDWFMLMCGPAPFRRTVTVADGPAALYDADGAYIDGASADGSGPVVPLVDAPSVAPALPSAAGG